MNVDTVYKYHPKLKESTKKHSIYYILIYKRAKYFMQTRLWHKTGCHVLFSVLNADTKVSYFKLAWSCDSIQTVLNVKFNMYTVPFHNCILKTQRGVSYPEHIIYNTWSNKYSNTFNKSPCGQVAYM